MPPVLPARGHLLEEDGDAAGEDGVERGPAGRGVPGRLQTEPRPQHRAEVAAGLALAGAAGAVDEVAEVGAVLALGADAVPDVGGRGGTAAAGEEHEGAAGGAAGAGDPVGEAGRGGGMEGGRVGDGLLLPRPGAGLEGEGCEVEEGGEVEEGSAPRRRFGVGRLREVPRRPGQDEEVVVAATAGPDAGVVGVEEGEEVEAVLGGGVDGGTVEEGECGEGGVEGEEDGVGGGGVGGEAGVVEEAAVEEEVEEVGVGEVPAVGGGVSLGAEAVVGEARAEVAVGRVGGAVTEEVDVELGWEGSDVDAPAIAVVGGGGWIGWEEEEEEEEGGGGGGGGDGHGWGEEERSGIGGGEGKEMQKFCSFITLLLRTHLFIYYHLSVREVFSFYKTQSHYII